jgi:ketosteroid isomerase-like protein
MTDLSEQVAAANARFYRALGSADLEAMSAVWLHSEAATCAHPGWPMIEGWEAIRESWAAIFENQGQFRAWASEVTVHLDDVVAWVTCVENIDASRQLTDVMVQTQATNIFRLVSGQWKMVLHHASPLPQTTGGRGGQQISPN